MTGVTYVGWCLMWGLGTALLMELWAGFLHRYVWHTLLWEIHRTHHRQRGDLEGREAPRQAAVWCFELNDVMPLAHVGPAVYLIWYGYLGERDAWHALSLGVGAGMTCFGVAYLLFHEGIAHGRFLAPHWVAYLLRWRYARRLKSAHCVHHHRGLAPYGLFLGPWVLQRQKRRAAAAWRARAASPERAANPNAA